MLLKKLPRGANRGTLFTITILTMLLPSGGTVPNSRYMAPFRPNRFALLYPNVPQSIGMLCEIDDLVL